jgi:hypothetical protein
MVSRVMSLCDLHGIPSGRPADLADLLLALQKNKLLAMDFWRVVAQMSGDGGESAAPDSSSVPDEAALNQRERQELVLEGIVRAITGLGPSEMIAAGRDAQRSVQRMASLLAGEDTEFDAVPGGAAAVSADAIVPARDSASSHGDAYKNVLRARLREDGLKSKLQNSGPVSASYAAPPKFRFEIKRTEAASARPIMPPAESRASLVSVADQQPRPVRPIADDELRRILFGTAYTNPSDTPVHRNVLFRLPLGLRLWLRT